MNVKTSPETKTLLPRHRKDFYNSGLTDETIKASDAYSVTQEKAKKLLGFDPRCGSWVLPYPSREGLPDTIQSKPDIPYEGKDGKKRKYLRPIGAVNRVYVPPMIPMEVRQDKRTTLYIVEGEKKALKAAQEGLACVALSGVWNWRYRDEIGDSRTIPDLNDVYLKEGRKVVICFDSDIAGNTNVQRAEYQLAGKLRQQGALVAGVRLPPGPDGEKVGLDDYLLTHSIEEFEKIERVPIDYPKKSGMNGDGMAPPDSAEADWPDIIPFNDYANLPQFPTDMLPRVIKQKVESVAECYQVDEGLAATISLGVLATSMQGKAVVSLKTHTEPLNLYAASVLPSGERKSPVFDALTAPVSEYEKTKAEEMAPEVRESFMKKNILENRLLGVMKSISNRKLKPGEREPLETEANAINEELAEIITVNAPKFIVDDITQESLGLVMSGNNERLSIYSTEGDIFSIMAGRYSGNANLGLCLKAYSGDAYSNHRVGRKSYQMQNPCLTICLTVQPDVIADIGRNKSFRGLGLLARFLFSVDTPHAGYRERQLAVIPAAIKAEYSRCIKRLLAISLDSPYTLNLTPEANQVWDGFYNDVEISMRPGGQLEGLKDWGSKLPGTVARIAGLLHCAEHLENAAGKDISPGTVSNAVAIGRYYLSHALSAFGMMKQDEQIESAKKILEYLIDKKPKTFKGRDVLRHKNCFQKMEEVDEGLAPLVERHYIREIPREPVKNGRPPAQEYEVNSEIRNT